MSSKFHVWQRITALLLCCLTATHTYGSNLCPPARTTVGFFNGVWNTEWQALHSQKLLKELFGDRVPVTGESIHYQLFYNDTVGTFSDLIETFDQRAREVDGAFDNRLELFWEARSGRREQGSISQTLATSDLRLNAHIDRLYEIQKEDTTEALKELSRQSITLANYQEHRMLVDNSLAAREKLVFVAHSQGNLFMNQAYEYATRKAGKHAVKAIHIAPASPRLNGDYVLADTDIVIRLLPGSVPSYNVELPIRFADLSGHTMAGTYLNPEQPTYEMIRTYLGDALAKVKPPFGGGDTGFFALTATWDGFGDIDLHVTEPTGAHVYDEARDGRVGELDMANGIGGGPEHYAASCDAARIATGVYDVGIVNTGGGDGRKATVQLTSVDEGALLTRELDVGPVRGKRDRAAVIPVMSVIVDKDPDGTFKVTAR